MLLILISYFYFIYISGDGIEHNRRAIFLLMILHGGCGRMWTLSLFAEEQNCQDSVNENHSTIFPQWESAVRTLADCPRAILHKQS
jgi:hypothetical protein